MVVKVCIIQRNRMYCCSSAKIRMVVKGIHECIHHFPRCSSAKIRMVVKVLYLLSLILYRCSSAKIRMVVKAAYLLYGVLVCCSSTTQIRKKGRHCMTWLSRMHVSPAFISCRVVDRLQCTTQTIRHEVV